MNSGHHLERLKDPLAVARGRCRAQTMTPEQRQALAALAANRRENARKQRKRALVAKIKASSQIPTWLKIGLLAGFEYDGRDTQSRYISRPRNRLYVALHEAAGQPWGEPLTDSEAPAGPSKDPYFNAGHFIAQTKVGSLVLDLKALRSAAQADIEHNPSPLLRRCFTPALADLIPRQRRRMFLLGAWRAACLVA